jgi:hypothetical protein
MLPPLPQLTPGIQALLDSSYHHQICEVSRSLNNLFCLSALGVSEKWMNYTGAQIYYILTGGFEFYLLPCFHAGAPRWRILAGNARIHVPPDISDRL